MKWWKIKQKLFDLLVILGVIAMIIGIVTVGSFLLLYIFCLILVLGIIGIINNLIKKFPSRRKEEKHDDGLGENRIRTMEDTR